MRSPRRSMPFLARRLDRAPEQEVLPRYSPGTDHGAETLLLARMERKELWWIKGHTYWSSVTEPSAYQPPELVLAEYQNDHRYRIAARQVRLWEGQRAVSYRQPLRDTRSAGESNRLSLALLAQHAAAIDAFFELPGLTAYLHPRQTILVTPPDP
jgi:hypothetical protein